ncbi:MAG: multifunctional CCA addition/repair protein [Gammaproteobacteria bacterium]|nr:multifunctional CCA addition/repair protein [Gammaproteobacteria bacterium]
MTEPEANLDVYLVGGAVRDQIMGLQVKDRDWVVVGATPEEMTRRGFKPVGKDFPVFLHPSTKEEYALARSERKTGKGYRGFEIVSNPNITLEQDLIRRDLTMNAIAQDSNGDLVDPHGGIEDIRNGRIKHVSRAFEEDPVRVLRTARFAARYAKRGMWIDPETNALMSKMVELGEVDALVPERVWQELESVLSQSGVAVFFQALRRCGALERIFPELDALFGVPQVKKYHPEIDTGKHVMMSLDAAEVLTSDPILLFAVLVHDLGKALTPMAELPSHRGHESRGISPIANLCDRLRVPKKYRDFALKVCEFHLHCHRIDELKPATIFNLLEKLDGFRTPENVGNFATCCKADQRGRTGLEQASYPQAERLCRFHQAAMSVNTKEIASKHEGGEQIGMAIRNARIHGITEMKKQMLLAAK